MKCEEVIIHIGFPKTATTFLQRNVFHHIESLNNIGKPYVNNKHRELYKEIHLLINEPSSTYNPSRLKQIINQLKSEGKQLFLSDEAFLWNIALDPKIYIERFDEIFGQYKIIFVLRNQIDMIVSYYNYTGFFPKPRPMLGTTINFETMYQYDIRHFYHSFFYQLNYFNIIELYKNHIGENNILVLLYEDMKYNNELFITNLSTFINIDAEELVRIFNSKQENINSSSFKFVDFFKNIIKYPLRAQRRKITREKIINNYKPLCDYYVSSNKKLMKKYHLELSQYEYPLFYRCNKNDIDHPLYNHDKN